MTVQSAFASALAVLCLAGAAQGQLVPDRVYYGINRPVPMTVTIPADLKLKADSAAAEGEKGALGQAVIVLLAPVTATEEARAEVFAGPIDLADKFPTLWTNANPHLVYAQLMIGEQKIGAPVVIQPMVRPRYAAQNDRDKNPMFSPPMTNPDFLAYSGVRAYTDKFVVLTTDQGDITLALRPDVAPNTCWNFRQLVEGGFYTDIIFHRIVNTGKGFVIQVGDPIGRGNGGPGYFFDLEASTLPHDFGVLSMARSEDPNTNGSQVFICLSREGTTFLDGRYTSFGETVQGAEPIRKIASVPVGPGDRPVGTPPAIKSAALVDAPPYGEGRTPVSAPAAAPEEGR